MREYNIEINRKNEEILSWKYQAENAVIAYIINFPLKSKSRTLSGGLDRLVDIESELPKIILRNKSLYEAIFTLL
jgi:hypothetical protein